MAEIDYYTERYKRALKLKGLDNQLDITLEELAELIQAVVKYKRTHDEYDVEVVKEHIAEELADVEIMLEQLRVSLGEQFSAQANTFKAQKLARLDKRLAIIEAKQ